MDRKVLVVLENFPKFVKLQESHIWIGLMNNVRNAAEKIIIKELVFV